MRLSGFAILIVLGAMASQAAATSWGHPQRIDFLQIETGVEAYHLDHGVYPVTDSESTWFQKLAGSYVWIDNLRGGTLPDRSLPRDFYGNILVYEPPSGANQCQLVLRSVGENGIDEHGAGDDWDIRYGPHYGYWATKTWPAAERRLWFCAGLALGGFFVVLWRFGITIWALWACVIFIGILGSIVLPWGFETSIVSFRHNFDPGWMRVVAHFSVALATLGILGLLESYKVRVLAPRRALSKCLCVKCGHDLRDMLAAGRTECPKCGTAVRDATEKPNVRLP